MTSEIQSRADEIRAIAKSCVTVLDLARALRWPIQSATAANDQLALGLSIKRGASKPEQVSPIDLSKVLVRSFPKPVKKGGGK